MVSEERELPPILCGNLKYENDGGIFTTTITIFLTIICKDLALLPPPPSHPTWDQPSSPGLSAPLLMTSDGHYWRPVQTCSLKLPVQFSKYLHLVATEACTVGKRAVRILLECLFVILSFSSPEYPVSTN